MRRTQEDESLHTGTEPPISVIVPAYNEGTTIVSSLQSILQLNYPRMEVIEQALARWGTPEIVNTDQGSQFTAEEFTRVVLDAGCKLSMDGRGAWRDNVFVERLWRSVKYERVYLKAYDSVSAARADIADYLGWYNTHRAHSSLEQATPDEMYFDSLPQLKLAA
jgi:putative transposase